MPLVLALSGVVVLAHIWVHHALPPLLRVYYLVSAQRLATLRTLVLVHVTLISKLLEIRTIILVRRILEEQELVDIQSALSFAALGSVLASSIAPDTVTRRWRTLRGVGYLLTGLLCDERRRCLGLVVVWIHGVDTLSSIVNLPSALTWMMA
jgi:hypothetical protein